MALGPNKQTKDAVKRRAETIIDKMIRGCSGENLITISVDLLPDTFSAKDWKDLAPKYRKAGWRVATWESDGRDGDYILLEAK